MTEGNHVAAHPDVVRMQEQMRAQERTLERIEISMTRNHRSLIKQLDNYVTKEIFEPVRLVVFGLVGLTLLSVGTGVIALLLRA